MQKSISGSQNVTPDLKDIQNTLQEIAGNISIFQRKLSIIQRANAAWDLNASIDGKLLTLEILVVEMLAASKLHKADSSRLEGIKDLLDAAIPPRRPHDLMLNNLHQQITTLIKKYEALFSQLQCIPINERGKQREVARLC
jgi:hypothetical protein